MAQQDALQIKEKILSTIRLKGPGLPVQIAKAIETNTLFAGAFLSELFSEKKIKISHMKVGNSPIYFIPGQESLLERFSQHLKSKEKDAFELLKEKKFLKDSEQNPAIRVALRAIRDFALPFKHEEEIYWRYFIIPLEEFKTPIKKIQDSSKQEIQEEPIIEEETKEKEPELRIFEKKQESKPQKPKKTTKKKSQNNSKQEKFFNKVKEYLNSKSIEIIGIQGVSKTDLILKVLDKNQEKILIAYDKKRLTELDILKAHKKAQEFNLPYLLLSLGELPKKIVNLIEALKNLSHIEKIQ